MTAFDLKTRAGQLLYRELPEEYRYQDPPGSDGEFGDLEAFLHGFGHLLDLIRQTTEQAYADAFAEPADNEREIQSWLIPYLAELVGAELRAPDPAMRREELDRSVAWYKAKGSLDAIDDIADVVTGVESVLVEGWRRTLTTPRQTLPPFTTAPDTASDLTWPRGTPDLRFVNRSVEDAEGSNPLYRLRIPRRDPVGRPVQPETVFWRPLSPEGAPCFPGGFDFTRLSDAERRGTSSGAAAYDDTSMRTPDVRAPHIAGLGPHPARALIHVRPPEGFFTAGVSGAPVSASVDDLAIEAGESARQRFGPGEVLRALGMLESLEDEAQGGAINLPERVLLSGDLVVPDGADLVFEGIVFLGAIRLAGPDSRVAFRRCAIERAILQHPTEEPALSATDCLFNSIRGGVGFAELVHCTVLEETDLERLWASDCIFKGEMHDINCSGEASCIRYSRVPDLDALEGCGAKNSPSNTTDPPNFIQLWFEDGEGCVLRPALFGEPGAGVLDLTSSETIRSGAEDEGEMGAYHHAHHAASIRALALKLTDYLPFGQEIAIRYDPHLLRPPARAV